MLRPPCPLMEVPEHLAQCQVLLNFLREDQPDCDVIPTRIYEYLSTGLPIVTMVWPDQVEPYPDVIYSAHSPQEFLTLCQHALEEIPSWTAPRRRSHGAAGAGRRGLPHFDRRGAAVIPLLSTPVQLSPDFSPSSLYKPTNFPGPLANSPRIR